jgi:hypothetical protein
VVISPTDVPVAAAVIDQLENAELTSLHRYTLSGLRAWAVDVESGFADETVRPRLLDVM